MLKSDIINEIKSKQVPVIICGAGIIGKVLLSICEKDGIKVECFCDNSKKMAHSNFCGLRVIHTLDLKEKYKEAVFLISAVAIKDVVDLLEELGFSSWYAGGLLLKGMDVSWGQPDAPIDYAKFAIENCILCHDGYLNPDQLFLRSIDLIITERCSLRCRDCSNLMQYYEKPENCEISMLIKSINAFFTVIDEVMDFRIIGGDAFMNREWPIITKRLMDEPKAKRVVIYTNGTIVPKEKDISCLKNNKALIIITDYGVLSKKLIQLKQVLEQNRIAYYVLKVTEWLDCAAIKRHNRQAQENKEIYKVCCAKNMATLSDGKVFRCPYSANAFRLSAVADSKSDYVDLFKEPLEGIGLRETKNKLRQFLLHKEYLATCDYCNGRPLSGVEVQPAVQANNPLDYHKYRVE